MALLEKAKSSRSNCKMCKSKIAKNTFRFGQEDEMLHGSKPSYKWYHLECAIMECNPMQVMNAIIISPNIFEDEMQMKEMLIQRILGAYTVAPGFEITLSNRSKCCICHKAITKDTIRGVVTIEGDHYEEKRYTHLECTYQGLSDMAERMQMGKASKNTENAIRILLRRMRFNTFIPNKEEETKILLENMYKKAALNLDELNTIDILHP